MGKWIFRIVALLAAIALIRWFLRRNRAANRRDRNLIGCTGKVETAMAPGGRGRVRVKDKDGQFVILPATLDENVAYDVGSGTEIVVIENARNDAPIIVSIPDLPGSD